MKTKIVVILLVPIFMFACNDEPVEFTSVGEILDEEIPDEETDFFTGLTCTGSGDFSYNPLNVFEGLTIPNNLPESHDLSEFLPPIKSQGQQGSCVSWAVSYYMKSLQEKIQSGLPYTPSTIMSPAYTYNQLTQGNCVGTSIPGTLEILINKGVCSWNDFPYSDSSCSEQPNETQDELALINKIDNYKSLSGQNLVLEMKALINEQIPIIIGAYLSSEFGKRDSFGLIAYREHDVEYGSERCHAMLVVGYSDNYNAFKVVNSWGSNWGNNGFIWIDYKAFDNVLDETAEFRVINQAYIAFDL